MRRQTMFLGLVLATMGCTADPPPGRQDWQGQLVSYVIDRGGRAEIEHRLHGSDGTIQQLIFADPDTVAPQPGSRLRVWGREQDGAIQVAQVEIEQAPIATALSALIDGPKKPARRWAFVLL